MDAACGSTHGPSGVRSSRRAPEPEPSTEYGRGSMDGMVGGRCCLSNKKRSGGGGGEGECLLAAMSRMHLGSPGHPLPPGRNGKKAHRFPPRLISNRKKTHLTSNHIS